MIQIAIWVLTIVIIGNVVWHTIKDRVDIGDAIGATVFLLLASLIVQALAGAIGYGFSKEHHRDNHVQEIVSLRSKDSLSGCFFLGSGYIGSTENYVTFKRERGGLLRVTLPANGTYVFQETNCNPRMEWQTVYKYIPRWALIWPKIASTDNTSVDLFVPTNTIIEQFKIE